MTMTTLRTWAVIGLMTASLPVTALAQSGARTPYRQTPAVLAQLTDVPIPLDAPGLGADRTEFTSQAEMEAHLRGLKARVPGLYLGSLGQTSGGRDLPWLVFTAEGVQDLAAVRRLNRPIVWLMGQQHGNEPSGGEAMLALASALADGELAPLLDRITVVIVPRMNPDGAEAFTRRTGLDYDLNRDHLLATLPESRGVQAAMVLLPPDVVVDAHEYGASSPLQRFGRLNAADQTILDATHPGVPAGVTRLARTTFLPAMEARLHGSGLSSSVYLSGMPATGPLVTGGTSPGISRNYYGLTGAVSFLLESRNGGGREAYQRRVASHYLAAAGLLEAAAADGPRLRRTVATARRAMARSRAPLAVAYEPPVLPAVLPLMDSETGAPSAEAIELRDSRQLRVTETRRRPRGYLLAPEAGTAIAALEIKGIHVCAAAPQTAATEAFHVTRTEPITRQTREASTLTEALQVRLEARNVAVGADWIWVPMNQAGASVIAASLEPDSVGSHIHVGLVPVAEDGIAPVYRVVQRTPRTTGPC
ncbi:M14 family zinc carboxypeptidase [uncultured Brevundimonas sp.]|uniref:M14 family zinc carboxypeptidase n=1 Tax=uncultured Brevundimonas sp. TaxID=213418 RepID=UPI0030EC1005|tara:strand:- start:55433 stop:57034 length:1602 start_codon:yes stop_codon:yes gene_type:complete